MDLEIENKGTNHLRGENQFIFLYPILGSYKKSPYFKHL